MYLYSSISKTCNYATADAESAAQNFQHFGPRADHTFGYLQSDSSDAFTDYFLVCSGRTVRQVKAIVDEIEKQLRSVGTRPSHVEGYQNAQWVLLDCFDFVVHVFTQDMRRFYDLERLWGSATTIRVPDKV